MDRVKLAVIAEPGAEHLKPLEPLYALANIAIGPNKDALASAVPDAEVIFNASGNGKVLREIWPLAQRVRWVHSLFAGVEGVLFPELIESPVPLTNARGVYREPLGEFVIAAALFFAKDLIRMRRNQREHRWEPFDLDALYRQSLGIIGYGEIGRAAAWRAKALGMKVYATRRRPELTADDPNLDRAYGLEDRLEMIAASDYVVLAAPLTPETRGLMGEREIAAMKPTAVIMNVGRGPVIDEAALISALREGRIRGAALDVFDTEPLPEGHPYYDMENVLLSPHTADHTTGWMEDAVRFFVANFDRYRRGEPLENIVDKKAGY